MGGEEERARGTGESKRMGEGETEAVRAILCCAAPPAAR
jgi:hypothetical protein